MPTPSSAFGVVDGEGRCTDAAIATRRAVLRALVAPPRTPRQSVAVAVAVRCSVRARQRRRTADRICDMTRSRDVTHPNAAALPRGVSGPALRALHAAGIRT